MSDNKKPLSQVIREAIGHAEELLKQGIKLYLSSWYEERNNKLCSVCLGGAQLVGALGGRERVAALLEEHSDLYPAPSSHLDLELEALNDVRLGTYRCAYIVYHSLNLYEMENPPSIPLEDTGPVFAGEITLESFPEFKAAILHAADLMEAAERNAAGGAPL